MHNYIHILHRIIIDLLERKNATLIWLLLCNQIARWPCRDHFLVPADLISHDACSSDTSNCKKIHRAHCILWHRSMARIRAYQFIATATCFTPQSSTLGQFRTDHTFYSANTHTKLLWLFFFFLFDSGNNWIVNDSVECEQLQLLIHFCSCSNSPVAPSLEALNTYTHTCAPIDTTVLHRIERFDDSFFVVVLLLKIIYVLLHRAMSRGRHTFMQVDHFWCYKTRIVMIFFLLVHSLACLLNLYD